MLCGTRESYGHRLCCGKCSVLRSGWNSEGNSVNSGDLDYDSHPCVKLSLVLAGTSIARTESSRVQFCQQFIGAAQMWNHNAAAHHQRDVERLFLFDPRHT